MPYSDQTYRTLENRGYVDANGRIGRADIASDATDLLLRSSAVKATDDPAQRAVTLDELAGDLFGQSNPELRSLVAQVTAPGPQGQVQRALQDGHVLCGISVSRVVGQAGNGNQAVTRTFTARFVSANPDVVDRYALQPLVRKAERAAAGVRAKAELVTGRIPELESAAERVLLQASGRAQAALTAGDDQ